MSSFRIKTADTNIPDLQNLAASLSVAISYATGINWFIPNFQAANETIGQSTITNATITNLTATNLSTSNSFSNTTTTTFSAAAIASPTPLQLLGGIIVFTGSTVNEVELPTGSSIYANLGITTVGTTFDVLFVNKASNDVVINGSLGGLTLVTTTITSGTSQICKFVVSGVDQITVYG